MDGWVGRGLDVEKLAVTTERCREGGAKVTEGRTGSAKGGGGLRREECAEGEIA